MKKLIDEMDGMEIVGEAGDGLELLQLLKELRPDLVVLDISMPHLRGLEAAQEIKAFCPVCKILILTMHRNKEYLYHALSAGVQGYLLKEDSDVELFSAISAIREGRVYVTQLLVDEMARDMSRLSKGQRTPPSGPLTSREKEILKLVSEGKTNPEVADFLCISVRTVQHHRASIMRKIGVTNTADMVKYAVREGYSSLRS